MAGQALAAGVLGVAGWGIWRRSQVLAGYADTLPLPLFEPGPDGKPQHSLELIARQWVVAQINIGMAANGKISNLGHSGKDLRQFFDDVDWAQGATVLPPAVADNNANIGGIFWPYTRLILANSLNMMCLINDAQARTVTPQIPLNEIGGSLSFFNLQTSEPIIPIKQEIQDAIDYVENYVRQKLPVSNTAASPGQWPP